MQIWRLLGLYLCAFLSQLLTGHVHAISSVTCWVEGLTRLQICDLIPLNVVDPHHFYMDLDADPDSTYQPDADPNADPNSGFYLMRIRIFI